MGAVLGGVHEKHSRLGLPDNSHLIPRLIPPGTVDPVAKVCCLFDVFQCKPRKLSTSGGLWFADASAISSMAWIHRLHIASIKVDELSRLVRSVREGRAHEEEQVVFTVF